MSFGAINAANRSEVLPKTPLLFLTFLHILSQSVIAECAIIMKRILLFAYGKISCLHYDFFKVE